MSALSSYLLSTLSRVGSLGSGGVPDFHFTIGEKLEAFSGKSIWDIHNSKSSDGKQEATVFVFDKSRGTSYTAAALNALKRMRTLRHPGIVRYLEGTETPDAVYIATEPVVPLSLVLSGPEHAGEEGDELKRWGLFKAAGALRFINEDCRLVHANVSAASVFVTKAGEWRLGAFELMDTQGEKDDGQHMYRYYSSVIPDYAMRMAPEIEAQEWQGLESAKSGTLDGWGLACLIYEAYNGDIQSQSQMQTQGQIPPALWSLYQRLRAQDMRRRMTPAEFLQTGQLPGAFLDSEFVNACQFIENVAVKEDDERSEFFASLDTTIASFPSTFTKYKILPELLKLIEFGGIGGNASGHDAKVLGCVIQIGKDMDEDEYNELVAPAIVQLFGSNDRALRFSLLEHMSSFISAIPSALVVKKVFPNFVSGFLDAAPAIREATVKASLAMASKLSQKTLNNDLLKQLVRMVGDAEPGIRTNALICIGKLCTAKKGVLNLESDGVTEMSLRYVVCPALMQALRDQFPPVRSAALAVASACAPQWDALEISRRVIPCISPLLVDGEKPVRVAALKAINAMVSRIEVHAQTMPDTLAKKQPTTNAASVAAAANVSNQAEAAANMAGSSDGWGGWAVSSLSSTFSGALSLASSLPIGNSQQQYERAPSAPAAGEDSSNKPAMSAGLTQPLVSPAATSLRGTGTTMSSPTSSNTAVPYAAAPAPKVVSGGWEFNDDWDEGGDGDGWGLDNDDELWNAEESNNHSNFNKGPAQSKTSIAPTLTSRNSNTFSQSVPMVTKKSLKLAKSAPKKPAPTSGGKSNPSALKRKGLGAMKLGGTPKSNAILDELL
ncbi:ARM repeat-containing protein [Coemansia reversa NRRL 1564]|uniref:ARM repeat-containing protein n=1 Tax=Coemansia reversa (strain ATCC 12441 / NRRL 1564) TaxID=763665 RepID=A0A2G5BKI6_COERN|nr:ARM repeat-containing protein [Coemansia reversa NRRL 1564]|eukprot:PIA19526.1 ARM repeat-containing protein [Coemansia reversa NRRL 1564]